MLMIRELLSLRGIQAASRVKLLRHQDKRYNIGELRRQGLIELYQSYQSSPILDNCDVIVAFIGLEQARARLFGVYRVLGRRAAEEMPLPADFKYPTFSTPGGYFYNLEEVPGFGDLKNRVVINWGRAAISWHQWLKGNDKEVVEILPTGYVREFPGYLDFVLTHEELQTVIAHPESNREWHRMLSAVSGVYLITDTKTGLQYVGSASGANGVLGRWAKYAQSGHGGNAQLKQLLDGDPPHATNFQFTLLRTFPRTLTKAEVISYEALYKRKLGTRAFGLNSN